LETALKIGCIAAPERERVGRHSKLALFQFSALPRDEPRRSHGGIRCCASLPRSWGPGRPKSRAIFLDQGLSRPISGCRGSRGQRPLALRNEGTPRKQNRGGLAPAADLVDLAEALAGEAVFAAVTGALARGAPCGRPSIPAISPDTTNGFIRRSGPAPASASCRACRFKSTSFRPRCGTDGRSIARIESSSPPPRCPLS
jgi:hypothetical protein